MAAGGLYGGAIVFGGNTPPATAKTEDWNGNNFTEVGDLNTAVNSNAGCGSATAALSAGSATSSSASEEWSGSSVTTKVLTD